MDSEWDQLAPTLLRLWSQWCGLEAIEDVVFMHLSMGT